MNPLWHPRTGTTAFLPHLTAATELLVIDLVSQHDPQPASEFTSYGDSRFTQPFLLQLAPVKAFQLWVSADCVHACLTPEKTQQRLPCLLNPPSRCRPPLEYSLGIIPM